MSFGNVLSKRMIPIVLSEFMRKRIPNDQFQWCTIDLNRLSIIFRNCVFQIGNPRSNDSESGDIAGRFGHFQNSRGNFRIGFHDIPVKSRCQQVFFPMKSRSYISHYEIFPYHFHIMKYFPLYLTVFKSNIVITTKV